MTGKHCPYINECGDLVIPFDSNKVYHWWNKGLSIKETLEELGVTEETIFRYEGRL